MTVPAQVLAAVRSIPHPRQETNMTAPHPSPAEQAAIDRFGIFEEEEDVERVARALWEADPDGEWDRALEEDRDYFRRLAAAALAVMRDAR